MATIATILHQKLKHAINSNINDCQQLWLNDISLTLPTNIDIKDEYIKILTLYSTLLVDSDRCEPEDVLVCACEAGYDRMVKLLIEQGLDAYFQKDFPYWAAYHNGHQTIIDYLVKLKYNK